MLKWPGVLLRPFHLSATYAGLAGMGPLEEAVITHRSLT
jgi:hypothetical protein